ncbi:MAG TPA: nucleotide sugar dehydrogenase [Abditibacteriaceae bacterium]|jgi:UDP-N-acetyl-D-glucosamine dehydrogenase
MPSADSESTVETGPGLHSSLLQKIQDRDAIVGVLGLGYVGLPLIVAFGEAGFPTIGFEPKEATVVGLQSGQSHIGDIPSERVAALRASGKLEATGDFTRLAECDAVIICVPTPLTATRDPDLAPVRIAVEAIRDSLRPGQLVVLESTTYPGTTDEVVRPRLDSTGNVAGRDYFLAFSPERIDPGNEAFPVHKVPKVVGGHDAASLELACALYDAVVERTVPVSSTQAAELTKLLENIFRSVNIALVNEMALLCDRMNIDIWEVIDAASTKPYGFTRFLPGPGLGGHCIPIDPFYLSWKARQYDFQTNFIELAGEVNRAMPHFVVEKISRSLNDIGKPVRGTNIALLGMSYKPNVGDVRESPSLRIAELLLELGANLSYNDPYADNVKISGTTYNSQPLEKVLQADCAVLLTDHRDYDYEEIASHAGLIVDTRNAFKNVKTPKAKIIKL